MRCTSARLHPTLQCTTNQRPSRDSVIDCIDSSIGKVAEDELVVAVVVTDDVPPDSLAVLLPPTGSGCTRTRRRPASTRATPTVCRGSCRPAAWRVSTSTIRSVDRSSPPIDTPNATLDARQGRGSTSRARRSASSSSAAGSIERRRRGALGSVGRSHDQPELRLASRPLEGEQPVAGDAARSRDRRGKQLDEASVERRLARAVLRGRAGCVRSARRPTPGSRAKSGPRATGTDLRPRGREGRRRCRREGRQGEDRGRGRSASAAVRLLAVVRLVPPHAAPCASWSSST